MGRIGIWLQVRTSRDLTTVGTATTVVAMAERDVTSRHADTAIDRQDLEGLPTVVL